MSTFAGFCVNLVMEIISKVDVPIFTSGLLFLERDEDEVEDGHEEVSEEDVVESELSDEDDNDDNDENNIWGYETGGEG